MNFAIYFVLMIANCAPVSKLRDTHYQIHRFRVLMGEMKKDDTKRDSFKRAYFLSLARISETENRALNRA